jgi:DnaJ-class molecular chaperone
MERPHAVVVALDPNFTTLTSQNHCAQCEGRNLEGDEMTNPFERPPGRNEGRSEMMTCPRCNGKGYIGSDRCQRCQGAGRISNRS